jgi:heptosyltransferase-1
MNILVVRLGAMGDILHTLPAVEALHRVLHRAQPAARIYWIAEERWHPLLDGNPALAGLLPFNRRSASALLRTRQSLRALKLDVAYDFQGLMKSALVAWQSGARRIVGAARTRESLARLFYNERIAASAAHIVEQHCELAGVEAGPVWLPQGALEGDLPSGGYVLASPFAGWVSKQWPLEHYAALARMLPLPLVLNVAPAQVSMLRGMDQVRVHVSSIAGLIHATRRAQAVVGVDSGPLHLAAALGKPGVALFGGTDPCRNGPYGGSMQVLRHPQAVTSYERGDTIDPLMRDLTPAQVYAAIAPHLVSQTLR